MKSLKLLFLCLISPIFCDQTDLTVVGPIVMADGIGKQSVELIEAVMDDVEVNYVSSRKKKPNFRDVPGKIRKLVEESDNSFGRVVVFEDFVNPKTKTYRVMEKVDSSKSIRFAYSMLESDRFIRKGVKIINRLFDAVIVPDDFLIEAYEKSGVKKPVFCIPLGVNMESFLETPFEDKPNEPFTFGCLVTAYKRKNLLQLVKAFKLAFGDSMDYKLRINNRLSKRKKPSRDLERELKKINLCNVEYTCNSMKRKDFEITLRKLDCYISVSKGEGFSIIPREAMALGIPTILSDNSGQSTICKSGLVMAIPSPIKERAYYKFAREYAGHYYSSRTEDIADAMQRMVEEYPEYLRKRAGMRRWASQYNYETLKQRYLTVIKPKKISYGRKNIVRPTGEIVTKSKVFYDKLRRIHG